MRELQPYVHMTFTWCGTVVIFSKSKSIKEDTLLLIDLETRNNNIQLKIDHLWINSNIEIEQLNLRKGQIIEFEAIIRPYRKGYLGRRLDFGLYNLSNIKIIGKNSKLDPIKQLPPSKRINLRDISIQKK